MLAPGGDALSHFPPPIGPARPQPQDRRDRPTWHGGRGPSCRPDAHWLPSPSTPNDLKPGHRSSCSATSQPATSSRPRAPVAPGGMVGRRWGELQSGRWVCTPSSAITTGGTTLNAQAHRARARLLGSGRNAGSASASPVYGERFVTRISKDEATLFWLAGLGDQIALITSRRKKTFSQIRRRRRSARYARQGSPTDAPVILLAHEARHLLRGSRGRVALTLSGHTHGGQVRVFGYSAHGAPRATATATPTGHVVEGRSPPDRLGRGSAAPCCPCASALPPEIVMVDLSQA